MAELFTVFGIGVAVLLGDVFVCALVTLVVYDYLDEDMDLLPSLLLNVIWFVCAVTVNIMGRIS